MNDQPNLRDWLAMNASVDDVCREAYNVPNVDIVRKHADGTKYVSLELDPDRFLKARYMVADKLLKIREMRLTANPDM